MMQPFDSLPQHNLGLFRLKNVVGRARELRQLQAWFEQHPVVAITGPSGAGKSTLATMLAVQEAAKFEQGILWISATGDTDFNFYDIVRAIEDVLATGITGQPVSAWPLYVLQQIFGFNRLLLLDELTEADLGTVSTIIAMIGQIKSSGLGRFVLIGRSLPQPLLDIVGEAHLILDGLQEAEVQQWLKLHQDTFPILPDNSPMLHRFTGGHPLALKLVAGLWEKPRLGASFLTWFPFKRPAIGKHVSRQPLSPPWRRWVMTIRKTYACSPAAPRHRAASTPTPSRICTGKTRQMKHRSF